MEGIPTVTASVSQVFGGRPSVSLSGLSLLFPKAVELSNQLRFCEWVSSGPFKSLFINFFFLPVNHGNIRNGITTAKTS